MTQVTNNRGQTVVLAYVAAAVISVIGSSLIQRSFMTIRDQEIQEVQADLLYLAEGGVEDAITQFAQAIANFQVDADVSQYPTTGSIITTFNSGATASSTIVQAESTPRTVTDSDGVSTFVKNYHITTTVNHPTSNQTITLHQIISRSLINTFQHAVFYEDDLEFLPGPDMTLAGRVHGNSDIYLGANAILTVDTEYLRAVGDLFNRRKDSSNPMSGQVQIKEAGSSPANYPAMSGLDSDSPTWVSESQSRWNGTVQTGDHGVGRLAVPVVGSIDPGGYYDGQANVRILNGTLSKGGTALVEGVDIPPGTVSTSTSFYNNREGKYVKMTDVNLKRLAGYYDCDNDSVEEQCYPNQLPSNGLIYATRNDATSSQQPGIRLKGGSEIHRSGGLTVVSNDPVYIQGDFNTVSKKPTAVIADAMNMLSNNWDDANSTASVSSRTASLTTINTAVMAGIEETTTGDYNGGLENYPRMHEKWSGQELRITGSFVALWNSQIATGDWQYGNPQYEAPIRTWSYDSSFASGTSMPPFTPWAVEITKGAWWRE